MGVYMDSKLIFKVKGPRLSFLFEILKLLRALNFIINTCDIFTSTALMESVIPFSTSSISSDLAITIDLCSCKKLYKWDIIQPKL